MGIDFNFPEIIILGILAVVIFGPEKLPELARKAARIIAYLRRVGNDARSQLRDELGPEFDDLRLSDLNPKNFVQRHLLSADEVDDLRQIRDEAVASGQLLRDTVTEGEALARGGELVADSRPTASRGVLYDPEAT